MAFCAKNLSFISLIQIQIVKTHLLFMGLQHKHVFYRNRREIVTVLSRVLTLSHALLQVLTPLTDKRVGGQDIY